MGSQSGESGGSGESGESRVRRETLDHVADLRVYKEAYGLAMDIYAVSQAWPKHERYAMTDQARRASRSVCANVAEAWAKRRYPAHFVSKLSDAHAEAEETLVWLRFALDCGYASKTWQSNVASRYQIVIAGLVRMMSRPDQWRTAKRDTPAH